MTWDCQAYGPEGEAVGALCFFAGELGRRVCGTQDECRGRLAGERVRVFDRIQELAASGDPAAQYLAAEFTRPDQILGGGETPQDETHEAAIARIRRQAMRDHPFEPSADPRYCGHWSRSSRPTDAGTLTFGVQCGYPPDAHPPADEAPTA